MDFVWYILTTFGLHIFSIGWNISLLILAKYFKILNILAKSKVIYLVLQKSYENQNWSESIWDHYFTKPIPNKPEQRP